VQMLDTQILVHMRCTTQAWMISARATLPSVAGAKAAGHFIAASHAASSFPPAGNGFSLGGTGVGGSSLARIAFSGSRRGANCALQQPDQRALLFDGELESFVCVVVDHDNSALV
jgi:hypothetical protein